jgi:hypothetical protein
VLSRQLVAGAARHPQHHRHGHLAAEHVVDLRRVVDDLVHRDDREVHGHQLDHGAQAGHRRPHPQAHEPGLADRRVDDPLLAELAQQAAGDLERALVLRDVLAHHEDALVALHLLAHRLGQRLAVGDGLLLRRRRRGARLGLGAHDGISALPRGSSLHGVA